MTRIVEHDIFQVVRHDEQKKGDDILGYRIKECREEQMITQEELSRRANVSRTIISGLESGAITVTTTETLLKIAKALNKKVSEIFFE